MNINLNICRICLKSNKVKKLKSIFCEISKNETIENAIYFISGLKIDEFLDENQPKKICNRCVETLSIAKNFKKQILDSSKYWRKQEDIKQEEESFSHNDFDLFNNQNILEAKINRETHEFRLERCPELLFNEKTDYLKNDYESTELFTLHQTTQLDKSKRINKKKRKQSERKSLEPISFQCHHCGKICKNRTKLYSHEKSHEAKPKKEFECDFCGRFFALKSYIFSHMTNVHIKDKKYKCEYCQKQFAKIVIYRNHVRQHTNEKPFLCCACPKKFAKKQLLDIHTRVHTGERPYKCKFPSCQKNYAHYTDLRRHNMTHTGERPYVCSLCSKGFIKRSCLQSHKRTHLNVINTVFS